MFSTSFFLPFFPEVHLDSSHSHSLLETFESGSNEGMVFICPLGSSLRVHAPSICPVYSDITPPSPRSTNTLGIWPMNRGHIESYREDYFLTHLSNPLHPSFLQNQLIPFNHAIQSHASPFIKQPLSWLSISVDSFGKFDSCLCGLYGIASPLIWKLITLLKKFVIRTSI